MNLAQSSSVVLCLGSWEPKIFLPERVRSIGKKLHRAGAICKRKELLLAGLLHLNDACQLHGIEKGGWPHRPGRLLRLLCYERVPTTLGPPSSLMTTFYPPATPRGSVASFPREQDPRAACLAVASHAVQLPATNPHPTSAPILSRVLRGFPQTTPSATGLTFLVAPPQSWSGGHTVFHTGRLWALDFCYRSQYHTLWG